MTKRTPQQPMAAEIQKRLETVFEETIKGDYAELNRVIEEVKATNPVLGGYLEDAFAVRAGLLLKAAFAEGARYAVEKRLYMRKDLYEAFLRIVGAK